MHEKIYTVDAFAGKPFRGNPAGVCILETLHDETWMQHIAREMNLSETAFLNERDDGYDLRWFTPAVEVALCGHATLASAHILGETGRLEHRETAQFHTLSGVLTAESNGDEITLNFPATPAEQTDIPAGLSEALGAVPLYAGKSTFDYLIEVSSEKEIRNLKPDFARLKELPVRGVIVTSKADSGNYDFVSRFFAPGAGIDEDPVTGSAHCCLGPFWSDRLGRNTLFAYQASERGGEIRVRVNGDRVLLSGQAITVMQGEIVID